jgi:hypothetical protein
MPSSLTPVAPPGALDPLVRFVFLIDTGPLRGEVARVLAVESDGGNLVCVCETTGGPLVLPRNDVAVVCHRLLGVYHPAPTTR